MRTFSTQQADVLIDTFGESLLLDNGSTIKVIFESQTVAIQTDEGNFIETQENYLTTKTNAISYGDTFIYNGISQEIYNIIDDLSGIINAYFKESGT